MIEAEAHAVAVEVIRRKLALPHARAELPRIIYEGTCGPGNPGWEIRGDVMTVPMPHLGNGPCFRFRIPDLIGEIESPQASLFA
ncbi:MAG TPA: hypothetical protein VLC71_06120 [Thermomonas sp.]|nr:hypothetical protein [Thermomonas sp.]